MSLTFLSFGLGTLSELAASGGEAIEPWMHRRWVARMTGVLLLAAVAAATSWGLLRLRDWGRWALTIVSLLPLPALACGWLLLGSTANPELRGTLDPASLTTLSVMSGLACSALLLLWSRTGSAVFSPEYAGADDRAFRERVGCSGVIRAGAVAIAMVFSFFVLLMTALLVLAVLGLIRSV